jgi:ABC-type dipeptide/oligopeptide/nickel transport system permease component
LTPLHVFVARRLLLLAPMLLGITLLSFLLSQAVPADPVTANLGEQAAADPQIVAAFRREWGLDRPLLEQYGIYVWNLLRGNFGISISTRQPVLLDLRQRFPATIELAVVAMSLSILVGIPVGILSAVRRDSILDQVTRVVALVGVSMPIFWLGLVALLVFYAWLGWAPAPGRLGATVTAPPLVTGFLLVDALLAGRPRAALDALHHLALPAVVLSTYNLGVLARLMRGSTLDVLGEDYVRTARAKGLDERAVTLRHAARNALIPVVTVIGIGLADLLVGAPLTETVFAWPGLGRMLVAAVGQRDLPVVMGAVLIFAVVYVLANLVVDLAYLVIDPRIRRAR